MAEKVAKITLSTAQKALQSVIAPDINEIKGSIKVLNNKVDEMDKRLTTQIGEMDRRLTTEIGGIDKRLTTQIGEMDKRLTTEIRALSEKVDLVRDVEKLKIEVAELKRRR